MYKEGILFSQNEKMTCVHEAVTYLKSLEGIKKVVLFGHSGGGTLLSAYQAIAENGAAVFQGKEKIYAYDGPQYLEPADGLMLIDSNWGNAVMQVLSLDAAVKKMDNGVDLDSSIDLFREENGFSKDGSMYSDEFIAAYQKGQHTRNTDILNTALHRLASIQEGNGSFADDEVLVLAGAAQSFFNNKLFAQDVRLFSATKGAYPLIHQDGSITVEQVHSVRKHENPTSMTASLWKGGRVLSVKNYLSSYAIRTTDEFSYDAHQLNGVDWNSSYNAPPGNVQHIHVPLLVMGMTGGWEYIASETIYHMAGSQDKEIAFVEGASHKLVPATMYEAFPGQFGDTLALTHDYIDQWLSAGRFE